MIRWNALTYRGVSYLYDYKDSWGKRYYSFDGQMTWFTSKKKAFEVAEAATALRVRTTQPISELHIA